MLLRLMMNSRIATAAGLRVEDLLELAGAQPVAHPAARELDAAQLLVVVEARAAVDAVVVARGGLR